MMDSSVHHPVRTEDRRASQDWTQKKEKKKVLNNTRETENILEYEPMTWSARSLTASSLTASSSRASISVLISSSEWSGSAMVRMQIDHVYKVKFCSETLTCLSSCANQSMHKYNYMQRHIHTCSHTHTHTHKQQQQQHRVFVHIYIHVHQL